MAQLFRTNDGQIAQVIDFEIVTLPEVNRQIAELENEHRELVKLRDELQALEAPADAPVAQPQPETPAPAPEALNFEAAPEQPQPAVEQPAPATVDAAPAAPVAQPVVEQPAAPASPDQPIIGA